MIPARLDAIATLFSEGIEEEPVSFIERCKRRKSLLREGTRRRLRRVCAALRFVASPRRLPGLIPALDLIVRDRAVAPLEPPAPHAALARPDGLCGLARALNQAGALEAYSLGLALFGPIGPAAWWSPSRRWAARPGALERLETAAFARLSGLRAVARADGAFDEVVAACSCSDLAASRLGYGPALMRIYFELHDSGLAHSIEVRDAEGRLAAGAFGLTIGRVFMTESCFGPSELARIALILLDRQLRLRNYVLHEARLGCTPGAPPRVDLGDLGFAAMAREDFIQTLRANLCGGGVARWRFAVDCDKPPGARLVQEESGPVSVFASAA